MTNQARKTRMGVRRAPVIVALAALAAVAAWLLQDAWRGQPTLDLSEPTGGDFVLESADGPVALADFRGKVVLVYFGYTFCPDICPTSLALIAQALNGLGGDELERVQAIFISVDPERDTPERLARYTAFFHPRIIGATGEPAEIAEIAARYGAAYRKVEGESAGGYLVDHTSTTAVVAADGTLAAILPHGTPPPDIITAIHAQLAGAATR